MNKISVYSDGAIGYDGKLYGSMAEVVGVLPPDQGPVPVRALPVAFENARDYDLIGKIIYGTARLGLVQGFELDRFAFDSAAAVDRRPPQ